MIICIGPFCIPLYGLLPLLTGILLQFRVWFLTKMGWGSAATKTKTKEKGDDDADAAAARVRDDRSSSSTTTTTTATTTSQQEKEPNPTPGEVVIPESEEAIEETIARREAILLYGTATWCGPCKKISPVVSEMARTYPRVTVMKVDVDEFASSAARFGMNALPTFVALDTKGDEKGRFYGANEDKLRKMMEECFSS